MRVGLDSYTYIKQLSSKQWDLWDLLRHAVRLRLDELQIMHDLLENYGLPDFEKMLKTKAFLDRNGIGIVYDLGGNCASDRSGKWVKSAIESLKLAELLGAKVIRITPGALRDQPKEPQIELAIRNLKKVMDAAESYDIAFGIENHDALPHVADVNKIVEGVDCKYLGITLDTGNMYQWDGPPGTGEDPVEATESAASHIVATHIRDMLYDEETSRWYCTTVGEGTVDFPALAEIMKKAGYKGSMAQEFLTIKSGDEAEREAAIQRGMEYLRRL